MRSVVVLGLATLLLGACAEAPGTFSDKGYKNTSYGYEVRPVVNDGSLLPSGWLLDNYYESGGKLQPKEEGEYQTKYRFDRDGDGALDDIEKGFTYDLRFTHRVHSGVIWVRTVPISQRQRDTDLRVMMQDYVDDIAGAGYESVDLDTVSVVEKRYAAEVLNRQEGSVGDKPAFAAEFSVANIDQLHVAQDARKRRVKVVLMRPGFQCKVNARPSWGSESETKKSEYVYFPVLLIAGYASLPEDYAKGLPDFEGLLTRLVLSGKTGVELHALPSTVPTQASPSTMPTPSQAGPRPASVPRQGPEPASPPSQPTPPPAAPVPPSAQTSHLRIDASRPPTVASGPAASSSSAPASAPTPPPLRSASPPSTEAPAPTATPKH